MNVISIDGVEYIKVGIIAKQYKYTADYVGQLCRGRKVDAKLIGRTWYVNPLSLTSHKSTRYPKDGSDEKTIDTNANQEVSRPDVKPVVRKTTMKVSGNISSAPANFLKRVEWQPLKYETDEAELNPNLQHLVIPVRVNVDLADSTNLKINSISSKIILEADPLPAVALRGTLNLSSLDVDFDIPEQNIASSEVLKVESEPEPRNGNKVSLKKIITLDSKKALVPNKNTGVREISESEATYNVKIKNDRWSEPLAFTPTRVKGRTISNPEPDFKEEPSNQLLSLWPIILLSVFGIGILMALYVVEFSVTASTQIFTSSWQINTELVWPF